MVLIAFGLLAGAALPPTSSVLRAMWGDLLEPRLHQAAYALDSTMIELIFITGPLLTAAITALASPAARADRLAAGGDRRHDDLHRPARDPRDRRTAEAAGCRAPRRARVARREYAGADLAARRDRDRDREVGIPGFARHEGAPAAAGVLLAMWACGSGIGGLIYGLLPRPAGLRRMHLMVAAALPLTIAPLAAAPSVAVMALLVIPAGSTIAPLLATRNELVARVAPEGARTEAYTWPMTAFVGGIAIGSAIAGALVQGPGWRTAFATATAIAAAGFVLAVARRRTLERTSVRVRPL